MSQHVIYESKGMREAFVKCLVSDKLGPKSDKYYFVGYPEETERYSFYNSIEKKLFVARTAVFLERELLSKKSSGRNIDLDEDRVVQNNIEPELESGQECSCSGNICCS